MAPAGDWQDRFLAWGGALWEFLPSLAAAAAVLLLGWIAARLARGATVRLGHTFDRGLATLGRHRTTGRGAGTEALGQGVFWVVVLAALTGATQILALESFGVWLNRLLLYLPTLLTGGLILAAGFFISVMARKLAGAALPTGLPQSALLGRLLQAVILVTAVVLGADQIGLDVTFLVLLGAVLAGSVAGGMALALSLGSGPLVRNLIGAHHLRQQVRAGQLVRAGDYEGRVIEVSAVALILDSPEGRVHIPGGIAHEAPLILEPEGSADG